MNTSVQALSAETKAKIDSLSIHDLLFAQRFAPVGDHRFQGAEGEYRMKRLSELRSNNPDAYVSASKEIGWSR